MLMHVVAALVVSVSGQPEPAEAVIPEQALAMRVEAERLAQRVIPSVVIVEDAASYLAAISAWKGPERFPVLWDDGSVRARADIARFVRGFGPDEVVRYAAADEPAWPAERAERIGRIERALFATVLHEGEPESMRGYAERLREAQVPMVGLVLTDPDDPGWAGSLALAAGHFQPLGFMNSPGSIGGSLRPEQALEIEHFARSLADAFGLAWAGPIDEVDALTIGFDCPAKVLMSSSPNEFLATTDLLGRPTTESSERWAWCGQIDCSSEARSVYMAMCGIFLSHNTAWVFDSYPNEPSWNLFDGTRTGSNLVAAGWQATVFDEPRQSLTLWRAACARGIDAGMIFVNTMGNADFFRLRPGDGAPGDVPLLTRPAGVHFVHSFSAARAGQVDTVAGRWLEHGAYAYLGSVQEPTLGAFVPTPTVADRLARGFPFGVSVRQRSRPWKLATIGDPLATFRLSGPRVPDGALPLAGVTPIGPQAREWTGQERFAEAIEAFALMGDDESAARLAGALLRDRPDAVDAAVARAALLPLFNRGKPLEVVACFRKLSPRDRRETLFLDALWSASRLRMYADADVLSVLRQFLRPGQVAEDAIELAEAWKHVYGSPSAVGMLQSVRSGLKNERDLKKLDKRISEMMRGG